MYLFFDTETTGLPKSYKAPVTDLDNWPRLVQLAYLLYDEKGNKLSSGDYIVKPEGFVIPGISAKIHGISTEKAMQEGKALVAVLELFKELVGQAKFLVAHNMAYDEKILGAEYLRKGMPNVIEGKEKICTQLGTVEFCALRGPYGLKWPKLSELHFILFNTGFDAAHNAAADISATARCFWELKRLGKI